MEKVVTKKSFIGGRMVYPGEIVDVDEKGAVAPAGSTPIGNLSLEQLETALAARKASDKRTAAEKEGPKFGDNVADPTEDNTRVEQLAMAPVAPFSPGAVQPQGIPPGTEPHLGGFVHPAPEGSPAAIEEVTSADVSQVPAVSHPLDHDDDGRKGGSKPRAKK